MKKLLLIFVIPLFVFFTGCSEDKDDNTPTDTTNKEVASCEGCHTNYTHLKAVYTPDPPSSGGGCGGETPHIEPYDRVYMGGSGYTNFKSDIHGKIPCTACHNGVDKTADKTVAHSGDFMKKPTTDAIAKCGSCHPNIASKSENNVHQGWGQKSMVCLRAGVGNVPNGFAALSQTMKDGYNTNCGKCHATCGDCHVNRPIAGGGGLYQSHNFFKRPNMVDHCTTCHTSRGGHAYFGIGAGTVPDVHLTGSGFTCMNCHTKHEIHGDGNMYDLRYKYPELPKCTNCHSNISSSNPFHTKHISTFSCNTCHSQDYNNCGSCHIGSEEGARIHAYQGYKIGISPIQGIRPFEFTLLRRSLMAPDSWQNYGIANLSNFNVAPTYKYTTPHNIIKITTRTGFKNGSGNWVTYTNCTAGCHISKNSDGTYNNKELYLFDSDCIETWEKSANTQIIVDGKLPASWQVN
jgi:thiosulfate/3-mercaptopyruvate sulfurtransferase